MYKKYKLPFLPRFVNKVIINAAGLFPTMRSLLIVWVRSVTVMKFTSLMHALVLYDIANACMCFYSESEAATASSASLLAMPLGKLLDSGTCLYPKWTSNLEILAVKVVCGLIIPYDS